MKAVFVIFNQVLSDELLEVLNKLNIRGFTKFNELQGRGSENGEPHMGSHTWPSLNNAILTILRAEQVDDFFNEVQKINEQMEEQGIRVMSWSVEKFQ